MIEINSALFFLILVTIVVLLALLLQARCQINDLRNNSGYKDMLNINIDRLINNVNYQRNKLNSIESKINCNNSILSLIESKLDNKSDYDHDTLMKLIITRDMLSLLYSLEGKLDKDLVKKLIAYYDLDIDDKKKKK